MTPWHLGALHPYEQALVLVLAFGPFAVLGVVVWLRSKEGLEDTPPDDPADPTDPTPEDRFRTP